MFSSGKKKVKVTAKLSKGIYDETKCDHVVVEPTLVQDVEKRFCQGKYADSDWHTFHYYLMPIFATLGGQNVDSWNPDSVRLATPSNGCLHRMIEIILE